MKSLIGATLVALALSQPALSSDYNKVNGSINVPAGETVGEAETVNGSIQVGERAKVGSIETVNGSITLAAGATAGGVETVNGSVKIGRGAQVSGDVEAVNGKLSIEDEAVVGGQVSNVNGNIEIARARIKGKITTVAADLTVGAGGQIDGGIHYQKAKSNWLWSGRAPRVVIGPDAVVGGSLVFERDVVLYVSDTAKIGRVTGAKVINFTGASPPG